MATNTDYFSLIDALAGFCHTSARILKSGSCNRREQLRSEMRQLSTKAGSRLSEVCSGLYYDFMPPLERDDIYMLCDSFVSLQKREAAALERMYVYSTSFCNPDLSTYADKLIDLCGFLCDAASDLKFCRKKNNIYYTLRSAAAVYDSFSAAYNDISHITSISEKDYFKARITEAFSDCFRQADEIRRLIQITLFRNC